MFKSMKKIWDVQLKHSLRVPRRRAPLVTVSGMLLQRSSSAALPYAFDHASHVHQSGLYRRSMCMTSGSNIRIPTPVAVIASNGRQLQTSSTDMPIDRPPHTLQVNIGAEFSKKLKIWIVSVVATDYSDNVTCAKLRGYNPSLPSNQSSLLYKFDSELYGVHEAAVYGVHEAAVTVSNDMDLSPYPNNIQFITDSKELAENINKVHVDSSFMVFSDSLIHNTRQELSRLLENRDVSVCWTRENHELSVQFRRRVMIAVERPEIEEQTIDNFKEQLMEGIVYDNESIMELIQYL